MRVEERRVRLVLFVFRCCGAATGALWVAVQMGLSHPVWSAMSALIVSQERLNETESSLWGQIFGTIFGVVVTCCVNLLLSPQDASIYLQIGVSVAICAIFAHMVPLARASMWTCPIVLITAEPGVPILKAGLSRGEEVILGVLVGGALHALCEVALRQFPIEERAADE